MSHHFASWLQSLGINPPEYFTPGHSQRASTVSHPKKKNAWIKLATDEQTGWAKDHATMSEAMVWKTGETRAERTAEQQAADNAALSARLAERRAEELRGTMRAKAAYDIATPLLRAAHPYLQRKRMDMMGCRGIRIDAEGWLVVPMYRDGKLTSIQRISPEGEKRFQTGAPVKGAHFQIWRPRPSMVVLCEGLATGLAVFAAVPQAIVEVCFSASNLITVAERGEWKGMVAIASDNDRDTEERDGKNPGIEAAKRAAEIIGCGYAVPTCDGTDWHDFFVERLAILEKADEQKVFRAHPAKLREQALIPIRTEIMRAMKSVGENISQK